MIDGKMERRFGFIESRVSARVPELLVIQVSGLLEWYSNIFLEDVPVRVVLEGVADIVRARYVSRATPIRTKSVIRRWDIVIRIGLPPSVENHGAMDSCVQAEQTSDYVLDVLFDVARLLLYVRSELHDIPLGRESAKDAARTAIYSYLTSGGSHVNKRLKTAAGCIHADRWAEARFFVDFEAPAAARKALKFCRCRDHAWHVLMAETFRQEGRCDFAIGHCRAASEESGRCVYVLWETLLCLVAAGRFKECLLESERLVVGAANLKCDRCGRLDGRSLAAIVADTWFLRAVCCWSLGWFKKGARSIESFTRLRKRWRCTSCFGRCEIIRLKTLYKNTMRRKGDGRQLGSVVRVEGGGSACS